MLVHCRFCGRVHQVIVEIMGKVSKREANSVPEDVYGYEEAETNGDRFYIAAEFERGQLPAEFILGNGKIYGGFVNAPLQPETRYKAYLRGVTQHKGVSLSQSEPFHYSHKVSMNCRQRHTLCFFTYSVLEYVITFADSPLTRFHAPLNLHLFLPKCVSQLTDL